jgi:hypothetical protein
MKRLKHIITGVVWTIAGLYLALVLLTHFPPVQSFIGSQVASALSHKLGTEVNVGKVNLGFFNRIIIDDVTIFDQKGKKMLMASRVSAKFEYIPLTKGKIAISSAQLFGLHADLYKETADSKPNYQFVLDSLASKDTTSRTPLDLAIHSFIIRNGQIKYDQLDAPNVPHHFSPKHINAKNISAHLILNALTDDSLNLNVKKMAFQESKGLNVVSLSFKVVANKTFASLEECHLLLPNTSLSMGKITASYRQDNGKLEMPTLRYDGKIDNSKITLSDLKCFEVSLNNFIDPVFLTTTFSGTSTSLRLKDINLNSHKGNIQLHGNGSISDWQSTPKWYADITNLKVSSDDAKFIAANLGKRINIPEFVTRLGDIQFRGEMGGFGKDLATKGIIRTDAGKANIALGKHDKNFTGRLETEGLNLNRILKNDDFGLIATSINVDGQLNGHDIPDLKAKGIVSRFDYKSYSYKNLLVDGIYSNNVFKGSLGMDDPNGKINMSGTFSTGNNMKTANLTAQVRNFNPSALKISNKYAGKTFDFDVDANVKGQSFNTANGILNITNFSMKSDKNEYSMASMSIKASDFGKEHQLEMVSDFGNVQISGQYDYASIIESITNQIGNKLPTLPGLPKITKSKANNFAINATINRSDWLQQMLDIPLELNKPLHIEGNINDSHQQMNITLEMPQFTYDGNRYEGGYVKLSTPDDSLNADVHVRQLADNGLGTYWKVNANAADNKLSTILSFNNNGEKSFKGQLNAETQFFKNQQGTSAAHINIHSSEINVGDSIWTVNPSDIVYSKNHVTIDHFAIEHNKQHIIVSGLATNHHEDVVTMDLQDVDVSYIMNLINFHSVDFGGHATGHAYIAGAFNEPEASADLMVKNFTFENGRMGILSANAKFNNAKGQIDIDAIAYDEGNAKTIIKGYVSPKKNYIDLNIDAQHTRAEFLEGFCSSFMRNVDVHADGALRVFGDLSAINLTGKVIANGSIGMKPLNTTYTLRNDTITMVPDEIQFKGDSIFDKYSHNGIVTGALHHKNLTRLTYDFHIAANDMLAYDFKDFGKDTYFGTVYATGDCGIKGKSGSVDINIDMTPQKGSFIEYNAGSPTSLSSQEFIHWSNRGDTIPIDYSGMTTLPVKADEDVDIPSDIHLNFIINCTQDATLKVLLDQESKDMISLNGDGVIRATYYNKGNFDMFGTYVVDHGTYDLTIQKIIKRNFQFQQGGTIVFGGDAYNAALNLKAQYIVNGVSLSDLNIGKSFASNNIRVNCLMNITGTPASPKVDFGFDLPTVNGEAKQMITSLINSEEGMNQQVLYLLAIGRFYSQGNNNATTGSTTAQQSQTSLAMQSILSGQLSQQLNNVLHTVVNNSNWNLGANISTGNEGFNNAEYEGMLSGRLFNNRLLINGQFGYRDKANATTSFIGDFDLRYLIFPNGNFAIRVYNQTNDRYFTRNSLNTQGLGLILKKDFNGWRELFGIGKKKKTKSK